MLTVWLLGNGCESHPLSDLVHVLGENVMHVSDIGSQELLFGVAARLLVTG